MDRQGKEGAHASTRHNKDQRPALKTKTAKYIDGLEQRLAKLESRTPSTASHALPPKTSAAFEFDAEMTKFDDMHAKMEQQIKDLHATYMELKVTTEPYHEYRSKIATSVQHLEKLQDILQTSQTDFPASTLRARFAANESALRDITSKVQQLQDAETPLAHFEARFAAQDDAQNLINSELLQIQKRIEAQDPPISTHDLAKTLTLRLNRGDVLDEATSRSLRFAVQGSTNAPLAELGVSVPPVHLPETPITEPSASADMTVSSEHTGERSAKRRRGRRSGQLLEEAEQEHNRSSLGVTNGVSFRGAVTRKSQADASAPRKSNRKPRPVQGYGGEIHWDFADTSVRGFRRSIN